MQVDIANMVAAVAAVSALALALHTYRQQKTAERVAYMTLALSLDRPSDQFLIARTCLENRSPTVKQLDVVRLLICPQSELPEVACAALMGGHHEITHLRDIGVFELEDRFKRVKESSSRCTITPGKTRKWRTSSSPTMRLSTFGICNQAPYTR